MEKQAHSSATKPRVLVVTTWFPTSSFPTSGIFCQRDVEALSTIAHVKVLHLCAPQFLSDHDEKDFFLGDVHVQRIVMSPSKLLQIHKAARLIRKNLHGMDLLHTMAPSTLIPMMLVQPCIPWVHTEHWSGLVVELPLFRRILRHLFGQLYKRPTRVVTVSELLKNALTRFRSATSIDIIPNIVSMPLPPQEFRERTAKDIRIIGIGGLISRKRPLLVADVCHVLRQRGYEASLTWVGEGPLCSDLQQRCHALGVPLTLTGLLNSTKVAKAIASADVFLGPSEAETFFLAAAEALAVGRPAIGGEDRGQSPFVHPPFGRLIAGSDPHDFADAVLAVDKAAQESSPENIADEVRTEYSEGAFAARYQSLYCGL